MIKRIVVDGNDGTGKSVRVEKLRKMFPGITVEDRGIFSEATLDDDLFNDILFSTVLNNKVLSKNRRDAQFKNRVRNDYETLYIILDAEIETCQKRILERGDSLDCEFHNERDLIVYRNRFLKLVELCSDLWNVMYIKTDTENLNEDIHMEKEFGQAGCGCDCGCGHGRTYTGGYDENDGCLSSDNRKPVEKLKNVPNETLPPKDDSAGMDGRNVTETVKLFEDAIWRCRNVFTAKLKDYGPSWRIMRPYSVTDQIYIKASRIRFIEEHGTHLINDGVLDEFVAVVNYCLVALIQLELGYSDKRCDITNEYATEMYDKWAKMAYELMIQKNHDYNEAWKLMRVNSYTDFILMKIFRVMEIEENGGRTMVSEGVESNYMDIMNYAVFGIIKLTNKK